MPVADELLQHGRVVVLDGPEQRGPDLARDGRVGPPVRVRVGVRARVRARVRVRARARVQG